MLWCFYQDNKSGTHFVSFMFRELTEDCSQGQYLEADKGSKMELKEILFCMKGATEPYGRVASSLRSTVDTVVSISKTSTEAMMPWLLPSTFLLVGKHWLGKAVFYRERKFLENSQKVSHMTCKNEGSVWILELLFIILFQCCRQCEVRILYCFNRWGIVLEFY